MDKTKFGLIAGICLIAAVVYFVIPVDMIPDLIAGIGWLDDILVSLLGLAGIAVNLLWAFGILPVPGENYGNGDSYYEDGYGEYREV